VVVVAVVLLGQAVMDRLRALPAVVARAAAVAGVRELLVDAEPACAQTRARGHSPLELVASIGFSI
jgi:hypothetical protein